MFILLAPQYHYGLYCRRKEIQEDDDGHDDGEEDDKADNLFNEKNEGSVQFDAPDLYDKKEFIQLSLEEIDVGTNDEILKIENRIYSKTLEYVLSLLTDQHFVLYF